jgi:hypothetical protein
MTVIRPNSITGVTSITAQGDNISFYSSDGVSISQFNANINATSGVSTVANLNVTGIATISSTLDVSQATTGIALPQGTTEQRPTGSTPYLRWNTTNTALEFYNGTDWVEIISDYFPSGSTILG